MKGRLNVFGIFTKLGNKSQFYNWVLTLLPVFAAFLVVLWPYRQISPLWDTRWYWFLCIAPSLVRPLDLMAFNCSHHPNMAFFMPLGLLARFTALEPLRVHQIIGVTFGLWGIWLYFCNLMSLKKRDQPDISDFLNVAAFAMSPIFLANIINLAPEVGSTTFMLGFLFGFLNERILLMALFGAGMVFTKEPLIMVYLLSCAYFGGNKLIHARKSQEKMWPHLMRLLPLVLPILLLMIYALLRIFVYKLPLFHGLENNDPRVLGGLKSMHTFNFDSEYVLTVLIQNYVASFMWVPLAVVALWCMKRFYLRYFSVPVVRSSRGQQKSKVHFWVFYAIAFYSLTRVIPVVNPRYLLPLLPLTLLAMAIALEELTKNRLLKSLVLSVFLSLLVVSQTKTRDPFSKKLLGTFDFGRHEILYMTQRSKSCCGRGMDPLVYNFEFTKLVSLQNKIFAEIKPTSQTVVVYHRDINYFPSGDLDPNTFQIILGETSLRPIYRSHDEILKTKGLLGEFYYIDLPHADSGDVLDALTSRYPKHEMKTVEEDGYEVNYYRFTAKSK